MQILFLCFKYFIQIFIFNLIYYFNFKVFKNKNFDFQQYAVEMERREGYSMLGIPQQFHFHFEIGGNVLVSLSDLNSHWFTLSQQQVNILFISFLAQLFLI